jgi:hypothetical protein
MYDEIPLNLSAEKDTNFPELALTGVVIDQTTLAQE